MSLEVPTIIIGVTKIVHPFFINTSWRVHNNRNNNFWKDKWLNDCSITIQFNDLYISSTNNNNNYVASNFNLEIN